MGMLLHVYVKNRINNELNRQSSDFGRFLGKLDIIKTRM